MAEKETHAKAAPRVGIARAHHLHRRSAFVGAPVFVSPSRGAGGWLARRDLGLKRCGRRRFSGCRPPGFRFLYGGDERGRLGADPTCFALLVAKLERTAPTPASRRISSSPPSIAMKITAIETHVCHARMRNWVFVKVLTDQAARQGRLGMVKVPLEVRTQVWYNPDLVSAYFMIPGMIGMILSMITSLLTAAAIVRERERGTIEQLIVTPIRSWELVVGKVIPYVILGFFDTAEVLIIGHWWFKIPVRGDLSLIFATCGLLLLSSLGIGLFASTIANTQQEAFLTVMFTMLPSIFLSGFFFPIDAMPKFLQIVSYGIPLRYFLVIIRALLLKGVGPGPIKSEIIALAIFGVVIMSAAALRFRKRLD